MISRNQLGVVQNAYQRNFKKVLTVCSAGCLRSPTAAHILASPPFNFNTRCCGLSEEYAIVPITEALVVWADVIVVMEEWMANEVNLLQSKIAADFELVAGGMYADFTYKQVINLDIPDNYDYRDPKLVMLMTEKFKDIFAKDLL